MQNKGAIKFVGIMFALVCIYQLSFTWVTSRQEKKANEYAQGDIQKLNVYLDSLATQPVYNLGVTKFTYRECKDRELNLGLDLKGGMNVILEVSVVDVVRSLSNYNTDPIFSQAIQKAVDQQRKGSDANFVTLFGEAFAELDPNAKLAAIFSTVELKDKIGFNSTNQEVLDVLSIETESAIANSFNILRTRIDRFGVTQPNIQRLGTSGRILVELPGIKDPERVRKLLQGTANLEFWETFENAEVQEFLYAANNKIKEIRDAKEALETTNENDENQSVTETKEVKNNETNSLAADTTKSEVSLLDKLETDSTVVDTAVNQNLIKDYPLFSVLQPRYSRENQPLRGAAVGISHFKDTAQVNTYFNLPQIKELLPRNMRLLWTVKAIDEGGNYFELVAIKVTSRDGRPALEGDVITSARDEYSQMSGRSEVSMSMNPEGAKIWARLTRDNVDRCIAIVLDNYVYSYPTVNQEIKGGRSSISGNFTVEEAQDLANILKSGKMPAPARIEQETIVGPSLGQEAIQKGLWSFVIAFIFVLVYMVFYYNYAGWVANLALFANVFFIFGVLASLGAVLTLPGIAGIVLTLGMAVDANVLIYERIREELAAGKAIKQAIKDGYSNAYSAIIDSNVTTLITAIILAYFGKGPIHGFAVTLIIGIISSLFTAIFISRVIFEHALDKNKTIKFASKFTENFLKNTNINFLGNRKIAYIISSVLLLISIGSLATRGLNQSVDFTGGRTFVIRFEKPVSTVDVQNVLAQELGSAPEVKTYGEDNQIKITTKYLVDAETVSDEDNKMASQYLDGEEAQVDDVVEVKIYKALKDKFLSSGTTFKQFINNNRMSYEKVGPTIASDIKTSAVYSVFFALIAIFLYILLRFRNWQFGLGAVVALAHDVTIILGVYSVAYSFMPFSMSIDQSFIAAILTVVGYSINDTVVVFDRIREYLITFQKRDRKEIMNSALNSTISRTVNTSLTTLVVLLAIFIFGGEVIRGFIFAMIIGIVVGTYSSLFVATSIVYDSIKANKKQALEGKRVS